MKDFVVLQFAKVPTLGKVKTRMQPALSEVQSLRLHDALLRHQLAQLQRAGFSFELHLAGTPHSEWFIEFQKQNADIAVLWQQGDDLGARMKNAIRVALQSYKTCLVIGSDCPFIDKALLQAAAENLNGSDCVISPAHDGGYVAIGFSKLSTRVFDDVVWGSGSVYEKTVENLRAETLSFTNLKTLNDIDRPEDLALLEHLPHIQSVYR